MPGTHSQSLRASVSQPRTSNPKPQTLNLGPRVKIVGTCGRRGGWRRSFHSTISSWMHLRGLRESTWGASLAYLLMCPESPDTCNVTHVRQDGMCEIKQPTPPTCWLLSAISIEPRPSRWCATPPSHYHPIALFCSLFPTIHELSFNTRGNLYTRLLSPFW